MRERAVLSTRTPVIPLPAALDIAEIGANQEQPCAYLRCVAREREGRVGIGADGGAGATEYSSLLIADRFAITAQVVHMIEAHAHDDGAIGIESVHRVESPAKAYFEHGGFYRVLDKQPDRSQRSELEIGERRPAPGALDGGKRANQVLIARLPLADTDPL